MNFGPTSSLARALHALATATKSQPISLRKIAKATKQSVGVLERRIARAKEAGLVDSVPGSKGGYYLVRAPSDITLHMVAECLGGIADQPCVRKNDPHMCPECEKAGGCAFFSSLEIANTFWEERLSGMTIAQFDELVRKSGLKFSKKPN